ncbi:MAG: hypothetical protein UY52_C0019G0017 [Parcubacteria group bacterium GW2011_GWC2_49_9]|nr:MAG: hypothetical protein UY34_C0013G0019 [Parcubacteria group bacterium GW2011_GWA2_48_9]KKW15233.1 MAG: hypothetical protein UY52_C0019G0017 [Parcubacteria group bacterium GW2011_GWC2_49_9]
MAVRSQIDHLLIYDPDSSRSTVHVFIAHPSPVEESTLGRLMFVAELDSQQPENRDIIFAVQHELESAFYSSEEIHPEVAFESALSRANQKIAELVSSYGTNWHEHFNIVAAVSHGDQIFFSEHGHMHIFLFQKQRVTDLSSPAGHGESSTILKVFTNVANGKLHAGEMMLITTSSLLDYFSQEKLRRMLTESQLHEAVVHIENTLQENINNAAFGSIIIQPVEQTIPIPSVQQAIVNPRLHYSATQASMEEMIDREQRTKELLSPSIFSNVAKRLSGFTRGIENITQRFVRRRTKRKLPITETTRDYAETFRDKEHGTLQKILRALIKGLASVLKLAVAAIGSLARLITSPEKRHALATTPERLTSLPSRTIAFLKKLPVRGRVIAGLALVVVFIFAQSIVSRGMNDTRVEDTSSYDTRVSVIDGFLLDAELAFSYDNVVSATEAIQKAQEFLTKLPTRSDEQKATADRLNNKLVTLREQANHVTRIDRPAVLTDLNTLSSNGPIGGVELIGSTLYAFSPKDNSTYQVDTSSGEASLFATAVVENAFQYVIESTPNTLLFLNTANALNEYTVSAKALRDLPLTIPGTEINIVDIGYYEGRLYLLDIANNQVWRAVRGASQYSAAQKWIQDGTDVRLAHSLAVDGDIYVLQENGSVSKFTRGTRQDFSIESVEPALGGGTKIWTDPDSSSLYILDAEGKRLLLFSKEGALRNQYVSEAFATATDIAINETAKKAYILAGTTIYTVDL